MRGDLTFGLVHGAWHRGACREFPGGRSSFLARPAALADELLAAAATRGLPAPA